jgi:hypothetical protein
MPMKPKDPVLEFWHKLSINHRRLIGKDVVCGCFFCCARFDGGEIDAWTGKPGEAALCPRCGIDSVLPEAGELEVTKVLLRKIRVYWFAGLPRGAAGAS